MSLIEKAAGKLNEAVQGSTANARRRQFVSTSGEPVGARPGLEDLPGALKIAEVRAPVAHSESRVGPIVEIDFSQLTRLGLVSPVAPGASISEQFRAIKRPIIRNAAGLASARNGNVIMVTSSLPGEGKTSTSICLAMSIAMERDKSVLLVDADVAKPSLFKTLQIPERPGLLDALTNEKMDLAEVLVRTNIPNVSLLGSGTPDAHATELLASDRMASLVTELSDRYSDRIIIFDSPPLLVTSEAAVLATHMGQIVMVVEAERSGQEAITSALSLLDDRALKLLVLNKCRLAGSGNYYGSYGESKYGHSN